ncbi:hypothetical protein C0993_000412 [Termitomyces sp. T159_Od127]|nr:hypothetical protein C0993_000412 [Termitomyces sp. T159_Od127]
MPAARPKKESSSATPPSDDNRETLSENIKSKRNQHSPLPSYLRRLQEAAAAAQQQQQQSEDRQTEDVSASPVSTIPSPPSTLLSPSVIPKSPVAFLEPSLKPSVPSPPSGPIPPSRYPIAADTYHPHYSPSSSYNGSRPLEPTTNGNGIIPGHPSPKNDEPLPYPSHQESFSTYPLYNWSYKQHQPQPVHSPNAIPPLSVYYRPHRLEDIAPRDTISLIIALFFDFVYPLTPCIHKPSFMADLHARREERDPLFFALVMSTVASTLVQVPRSYLPMERPLVRKLAQPQGKTATVSGLNYTSRIFALLGEILVRIRVDKRSPPQGQFATARLEEVQSLHQRILTALIHAPEPLRIKSTHLQSRLPPEFGGAGFRQATFAEVKDFFDNPNASRANALNPFLVMQANLYVTQQLVRFVIEQYRDELLVSLQGTIDEAQVAEDREAVASDLLNILHRLVLPSVL